MTGTFSSEQPSTRSKLAFTNATLSIFWVTGIGTNFVAQLYQLALPRERADVGDSIEDTREPVEKAKPVVSNRLILVHDKDLVEESVDRLAKTGEVGQRRLVVPCGKVRLDAGLTRIAGGEQSGLGTAKRVGVDGAA